MFKPWCLNPLRCPEAASDGGADGGARRAGKLGCTGSPGSPCQGSAAPEPQKEKPDFSLELQMPVCRLSLTKMKVRIHRFLHGLRTKFQG